MMTKYKLYFHVVPYINIVRLASNFAVACFYLTEILTIPFSCEA